MRALDQLETIESNQGSIRHQRIASLDQCNSSRMDDRVECIEPRIPGSDKIGVNVGSRVGLLTNSRTVNRGMFPCIDWPDTFVDNSTFIDRNDDPLRLSNSNRQYGNADDVHRFEKDRKTPETLMGEGLYPKTSFVRWQQ